MHYKFCKNKNHIKILSKSRAIETKRFTDTVTRLRQEQRKIETVMVRSKV